MTHCSMCVFKDHCNTNKMKHHCNMIDNDIFLLADAIAILKRDVRETIIDIQKHETDINPLLDRSLNAIDYICDKLISDEYNKKFNDSQELQSH